MYLHDHSLVIKVTQFLVKENENKTYFNLQDERTVCNMNFSTLFLTPSKQQWKVLLKNRWPKKVLHNLAM